MKGSQTKYHLHVDGKRTTATVDTMLSNLYALNNKINPFDENSHGAIRDLLQNEVTKKMVTKSEGTSQTLRYIMMMNIAPNKLRDEYQRLSKI